MRTIDCYQAVMLERADKIALESNLANNHAVLLKSAEENCGGDIRALRDSYKSGRLTLAYDVRGRRAMHSMMAVETLVISAFIRLAIRPCKSFHRTSYTRPGVAFPDYVQQCADAIYDCMYLYDGSQRFSTYVRTAMTRRLIDFTRNEERQLGVSKSVKRLVVAVKAIMAEFNCRLDTAIARLRSEEDIDNKTVDRLRKSMHHHVNLDPDMVASGIVSNMDHEGMLAAIERTNLDQIHRAAIDAHLSGDKDWRKKFRDEHPNPKTGDLYTPQRVCQIFQEACDAIRATYAAMSRKMAA